MRASLERSPAHSGPLALAVTMAAAETILAGIGPVITARQQEPAMQATRRAAAGIPWIPDKAGTAAGSHGVRPGRRPGDEQQPRTQNLIASVTDTDRPGASTARVSWLAK
jgi:hypothetical protein